MSGLATAIELLRPPRIEFGAGTAPRLGAWARERGFGRTLVVTSRSVAPMLARLDLPGEVAVFDGTRPEPDLPNLEAALALAARVKPDLVLGFGGGSAMDVAKLVAVLPGSGQTIRDVAGPERVAGRSVALAQVPTTAGTGSEGGTRALVTDPASRSKLAVQSRHMLADIAVVDPELSFSVPPALTAATGVDALAHCAEAFTSRRAHPLIDLYALEGIRLVGRFLPRAVRDGADAEARSGLMLASMYGGFCLGPVNTTAGHAVAYPLNTRLGMAHGLACALIFPHTLAFNAPAAPEKTALILAALGASPIVEEAAVREAARGFCASLGMAMRLRDHAVKRDELASMAEEAHGIRRLLDFNPRDITAAQIQSLYEAAY